MEGGHVNSMQKNIEGRLTANVLITCLIAASGGLIFGYDIVITGGITTMKPFLEKFFPQVLKHAAEAKQTVYCMYDSHTLTAFTSSLYIAGAVSSMVASRFSISFGRKLTMLIGGLTFFIGGVLTGAAQNVAMLILGRLFLGFGIGFNNQATPLYLAEVAPPKWRGALNTGFQLFIGIGSVIAALTNYFVGGYVWGWRFSLGFAIVPALIMLIGIVFITESPTSLVERGKLDEAKVTLIKVRGDSDVDDELNQLIEANELAKAAKGEPFFTILSRKYRPHLVMSIAIPFFQQVTGICIIAFYAPAILSSLGSANDGSSWPLFAAILLGLVNIFAILVSTYAVDRCGRRVLFLQGGFQMMIAMVAMAVVLGMTVGAEGTKQITKDNAELMLIFMCMFAAGFGWSWGPLSFIIPSEIFPIKIRSIGQSMSVFINFATTFVIAQVFLAMLCHLTYWSFIFFASWLFIMTLFVALFLPETKGIHIDAMDQVWQRHWFWRRYV